VIVDPYVDPESGLLRNRLGINHLQIFHREIFGDIYDWAGQIRTVGIARTDPFCLPQHIQTYAAEVFGGLAKERHLRGLGRQEFVGRVTHYLAEVNAVYPFREGNGRSQRAFFRQLARQAGWPIDWSGLDPTVNEQASMAALRGDDRPLRDLLDRLVAQ
jgi:cell filamentation protein